RAWVRIACQIHIRTAERAMQAAEILRENDMLSYLPPDGLLALASRSAPALIVNKIIGDITAGERPSAAQIKGRIAEAKKAEKHGQIVDATQTAHLTTSKDQVGETGELKDCES